MKTTSSGDNSNICAIFPLAGSVNPSEGNAVGVYQLELCKQKPAPEPPEHIYV